MQDYGFFRCRRSTTRPTRWTRAASTPRPPDGTNAPIDVGRVAIGQERLGVTPLQMAEVVATVANGGVRMRPSLVDRVVRARGTPSTPASRSSSSG